jgi:dTDP-4-amino-4,6-dideoxygalactose transaminase
VKYIERLLQSGATIAGDGQYTKKVSALIESCFGARRAMMTTSCTGAIEMATYLLQLKPKDEVIVPSFTFSSTANPILLSGARVVFADISEDTLNIDPADIERKITPRTRAVYPVHYAGVACDMGAIMDIAREHGLWVVEDAAHAVNATYKNKYLGTIGDFGCYSFHETKNYSCGEGGALLINAESEEIAERAEILREKGTDRSRFYRGETDKYTWVDIGSSYLPSDILSAFLYAQLEKLGDIQRKRLAAYHFYNSALKPLEREGLLRLPVIPAYAGHNAHLFYILMRDRMARDEAIRHLKSLGVSALFHYLPLHTSPMGYRLGYRRGDLPVAEYISDRLIRLPLYAGITDDELKHVVSSVESAVSSVCRSNILLSV